LAGAGCWRNKPRATIKTARIIKSVYRSQDLIQFVVLVFLFWIKSEVFIFGDLAFDNFSKSGDSGKELMVNALGDNSTVFAGEKHFKVGFILAVF